MSLPQRSASHVSRLSFSSKHIQSPMGRSPRTGSISSLLWGHRGSVAFRIGKSGFKVPRYQNTYQLDSTNPFSYVIVDKILENVMVKSLTGISYNPIVCMKLCQDMAAEIRKQIYKKDFHRYKYMVLMTIIQKIGQGTHVQFGYVWDVERDAYSTYVFENSQFYALGIVVGLYYD